MFDWKGHMPDMHMPCSCGSLVPTCMACAGPMLSELLATFRSSTVLSPAGRSKTAATDVESV